MGKTGVEMEALTAASVACLTIYDMCKAIDRGMEIGEVRLVHKEGGKERRLAPLLVTLSVHHRERMLEYLVHGLPVLAHRFFASREIDHERLTALHAHRA